MPKKAKKKSVKAAEKALATARAAVSDAEQAVRKLDKKTRRKADELRRELAEAEKSARTSIKRAEQTATQRRAAEAARITVRRVAGTEQGRDRARNDGASDTPTTPTYRQLREQAKARGIRGYSRMDKASLTSALLTG